MKTKLTTVTAILLILAGGLVSCIDKDQLFTDISGTWKVENLCMSGELINIGLPPLYSEILVTIPETTSGRIISNTSYDTIGFAFEINERKQIHVSRDSETQYVKNELLIWFEQGVDVEVFAISSDLGITPKELLAKELNIWLFETDETRPLDELINILSQNPNVSLVQKNHTITPRDVRVQFFMKNMLNTVTFDISNNELIFLDSLNNPIIIFNRL